MVDFAKHLKKRTPKIDLNPSSAERWTTCTASPKFIFDNWDKLPPHDNLYNQEGTSAHEVAAAFLQSRQPDLKKCPVPVDADMLWLGWNYMEYVEGLRKEGGSILVETKLPLFYMEGRNAIIDAAVRNPDELHIVDFKYGAGITVEVENNLQAAIYAQCVLHIYPPKEDFPVTIHIYQPRSRDAGDTPFKVWITTSGEILSIARDIFASAALVQNKVNLQFAPSEKACQWCPAKGFCDARRQAITKDIDVLAVIEPGPKHLPPGNSVSLHQLTAIMEHGDEIKKWIGDAQDYALTFVKGGGELPGYKLVQSRGGNRYWSNPKAAAKLLLKDSVLREEEVFEKKVIGPAAAEKLLGKRKFTADLMNLITRPPGVPVLAPIADAREALMISATSEFDNLDEY